jgi:hypothetical protein
LGLGQISECSSHSNDNYQVRLNNRSWPEVTVGLRRPKALAVTLTVDDLIEGRDPIGFAAFFIEGEIFLSKLPGSFRPQETGAGQ